MHKVKLVVVTATPHSHIQDIIGCRVVVHCIDMTVSSLLQKKKKKKNHMSEKHKQLKVLTEKNHISRELECSSFQYILLKFNHN